MTDNSVILYGAGRYVEYLFSKQKDGGSDFLSPTRNSCVCIADADKTKHNKLFQGLPVMSIQQALEKFQNADIYLTLGFPLKYTVLAWLTETIGIDKSRILNYEPVEKYPSCEYLQGFLNIMKSGITFCYNNFNRNNRPTVNLEANVQDTAESFINVRDSLIQKIRDGRECSCSGCGMIQDRYWALPQNRKISFINFMDYDGCNIKCKFCTVSAPHVSCSKDTFKFGYEEFFSHLKNSGQISSFLRNEIYAGEITVHPRQKELLQTTKPYYNIIYSNGVIFSHAIAATLADSRGCLFVSLDSGTREVYHKLKGIDAFDKVYDNLKRYSEYGAIEMKYIVIPDENDNENDRNGFIRLCKDINVRLVSLSRDYHNWGDVSASQFDFTVDFYMKLYEASIPAMIPYWQYSPADNRKFDETLARFGYIRKGN